MSCALRPPQGNAVVASEADIPAAWKQLGGKELYAEQWVPFTKELAVIVSDLEYNMCYLHNDMLDARCMKCESDC